METSLINLCVTTYLCAVHYVGLSTSSYLPYSYHGNVTSHMAEHMAVVHLMLVAVATSTITYCTASPTAGVSSNSSYSSKATYRGCCQSVQGKAVAITLATHPWVQK